MKFKHSIKVYGSYQESLLHSLARFGRLVSTWDDHYYRAFIKDGLVERGKEPYEYTLSDEGAHVLFHCRDHERGIDASLYGNWRTKAQARADGDLLPEMESQVKVLRGGKVVTWTHDKEVCDV